MQQFLSYIGQTYSCKNKLENSISELLHSVNRQIIADADLQHFQLKVLEQIGLCNNYFPRCKPVKASWYQNTNKGDWHLSLPGILNFHLYASAE